MNLKDCHKWARAMKIASSPTCTIETLADLLERSFPEPAPLCHVCRSPLNGDMCPKCQPEMPPDVSVIRYCGKEVEIAEPEKRCPNWCELALDPASWQPYLSLRSFEARWILRIKEQPPQPRCVPDSLGGYGDPWDCINCGVRHTFHPNDLKTACLGKLSVYGCDPREVDLSKLRGPRNLPVEWVDFREPLKGEWIISHLGNLVHYQALHLEGPDKRRIIVREFEERKSRRYLVEHLEHGSRRTELADLDDAKVLEAVNRVYNSVAGTHMESLKATIEAYLEGK